MEAKKEWEYQGRSMSPFGMTIPKYILRNETEKDWWISYCPTASDNDTEETAIGIARETGSWCHWAFLILDGDFRAEYEELIDQGLLVCIEFFKRNSRHKSEYSDEVEDLFFLGDLKNENKEV